MFTGIIEEVGSIATIARASASCVLTINAEKVLEGTSVGDSICVNGVCLTVVRLSNHSFEADVMPETLERSTLGDLKSGSKVNLERALTLSSRLGGHIVSGHIDTTCTIGSIESRGNARVLHFDIPRDVARYIVEKGSVAIEGVSLTVSNVGDDWFEVSLIPHSFEHTNLNAKRVGDRVNLECDILGKYVEKMVAETSSDVSDIKKQDGGSSKITRSFLIENGF